MLDRITYPDPLIPAWKTRRPVMVIGDVHGRLDLLDRLLADVGKGVRTILLGDLIDRGPDSLGVLRRVREARIPTLMGNHEDAMLRAVGLLPAKSEEERANWWINWLRNGGVETLDSLGLVATEPTDYVYDGAAWRGRLREKLEPFAGWLSTLRPAARIDCPLPMIPGRGRRPSFLLAVHAGIEPELPLDMQTAGTMLLTRSPRFLRRLETDFLIVHGHTISAEPEFEGSRINVDVGASKNGTLAGVFISDAGISFQMARTREMVPEHSEMEP